MHDVRDWVVKHRGRARQLNELEGLIVKSELVELTDDDRAVIFGALLATAAMLRGDRRKDAPIGWRR